MTRGGTRLTRGLCLGLPYFAAPASCSLAGFGGFISGLGTSDCAFYILCLEAIQRFWYSPRNRSTIDLALESQSSFAGYSTPI
jgi:hypothetical protein